MPSAQGSLLVIRCRSCIRTARWTHTISKERTVREGAHRGQRVPGVAAVLTGGADREQARLAHGPCWLRPRWSCWLRVPSSHIVPTCPERQAPDEGPAGQLPPASSTLLLPPSPSSW